MYIYLCTCTCYTLADLFWDRSTLLSFTRASAFCHVITHRYLHAFHMFPLNLTEALYIFLIITKCHSIFRDKNVLKWRTVSFGDGWGDVMPLPSLDVNLMPQLSISLAHNVQPSPSVCGTLCIQIMTMNIEKEVVSWILYVYYNNMVGPVAQSV